MAGQLGETRARPVALVTGGSRGLGLAAAYALLDDGADLAIVGRDPRRLRAARDGLQHHAGRPVLALAADLGRPGAARKLAERALRSLGRVDTVVAAAGDVPVGSLASLDEAAWRYAFAGKLFGHVALLQALAPQMRARGRGLIIAISGLAGIEPSPESLAAGAVNAALVNVMKGLARDLGPAGVRVVAISPGPFLTDRLRTIARRQGRRTSDAAIARSFAADVPLGRVGEPSELGALVRYLHSPGAAFLHGTTLILDGGKTRSA